MAFTLGWLVGCLSGCGEPLILARITCKHVYMSGSVISLRIDDEQKRRLDELSRRTGQPGSFYLREALSAHLADLEYVYRLEEEAAQVRREELGTVPLSQLERE
ncbi:ribbon-helix-helix domain-containing protein [Corynebacterium diphtheriae]|nr:Ribbon-helix-helix protein copG family protein [Corynebacterium diphtheriae]MBG9221714.1 ribbon-helix-helix domain-containing protein [Corynebacterium diphtheriae bv. mitis]MBG9300978.1 ribbon-helix-helix domain-containing protein [Corynebacterium diphtheriae bv. mitis]MBG9372154.1 ribbon-helix-helix domain-containing protein [Corynebacterium diphtheriae bv. mitis]OSQ01106.1 hypothetical protein B1A63_00415 [Corynebacterium diphtheriae]